MFDHLSPRECAELEAAAAGGQAWARVLRAGFLEGARLVLGIDRAPSTRRIAETAGLSMEATVVALREAARWCRVRGLLLMNFPEETADDGGRHLMAVG